MNFISSKTSLGIFKWFQIENIKKILLTAKFINESEKKKVVGFQESKLKKSILSTVFIFVFFALIVGPFWMFSNLNPLVHLPIVKRVNFLLGIEFADSNFNIKNSVTLLELNSFSIVEASSQSLGKLELKRKLKKTDLDKIVVW